MGSVRRMVVSGLAVVLVAVLATGWSVSTTAQDSTPAVGSETGLDSMAHPLVGSWLILPNVPDATPSLYTFADDGTLVSTNVAGGRHGTWTATGDRTAAFTALGLATTAGDVFAGATRVRAEAEVDATGNIVNVVFVIEGMTSDGAVQFTTGPFTAEGTRIMVEPLGMEGTPAAGTPETGTPEAGTPAAETPVAEVMATSLATAFVEATPTT